MRKVVEALKYLHVKNSGEAGKDFLEIFLLFEIEFWLFNVWSFFGEKNYRRL